MIPHRLPLSAAYPILLLALWFGTVTSGRAQLFDNLRTISNRLPLDVSDPGAGPKGICTGDFDGDGHKDFAVSDSGGYIHLRYGKGNGEFDNSRLDSLLNAVPDWTYQDLRQILAKDLNADGRTDLVVAAPLSGMVFILLNQGSRAWSAPQIHPAWEGCRNLAAGDFDGDGHVDLLVAGPDRDVTRDWDMPWIHTPIVGGVQPKTGVQFWKGDGTAHYTNAGHAEELAVVAEPRWWDEDPDSFPRPVYSLTVIRRPGETKDLVVATHALANSVWVLEWDVVLAKFIVRETTTLDSSVGGTGGSLVSGVRAMLVAPVLGPASTAPPDLLIASRDLNIVELRAGIASSSGTTGIFSSAVTQRLCIPGGPRAMQARDLDGDGWPELIVVARYLHRVYVFQNNLGTFSLISQANTGVSPRELEAGDFDEDGKVDFLVINRWSNDVSLLKGSQPITLPGSPPRTGFKALDQMYPVDGGVAQLGLHDLNGDGRQDVLQLHRTSAEVSIRLAGVGGRLGEPTYYGVGTNPNALNLTDYNNDGKLDIFTVNMGDAQNPTGFSVRLGNGLGSFGAEIRYTPPPPPPPPPTLPWVPGQPVPPTVTPRSSYFAVESADFDADGTKDLVIGYYDCRIQFFKGMGDGTFTPVAREHYFTSEARAMVTGDFDGDGDLDLAGTGAYGDTVVVENVGAFFTTDNLNLTRYPAPNGIYGGYRIVSRDVDTDGDLDLLVGTNGGILLLKGRTGMAFQYGTFPVPPNQPPNTPPGITVPSVAFSVASFVVADLDGDGHSDDLAAACADDGCLNISTADPQFGWTQVLQVSVPQTLLLAAGDIDGDGKPDLVGSGAVLWVALSSRAAAPVPPITARNLRTPLPKVVINEILPSNLSIPIISQTVPAGTKSDCVELFNGTSNPQDLTGWTLSLITSTSTKSFPLPTFTLAVGSHAVAQCKKNPTSVWQTGWRLPIEGAQLILKDALGTIVDEVTYPGLGDDISYTRYSDGQATFILNPNPDPGLPNEFNGTVEPSVSVHGPNLATLAAGVPPRFYAFGQDDTGIVSMNLFYRVKRPTPGKFQSTPLYDDGLHGDGQVQDSLYSGQIPATFAAGTIIEFYVEAEDLEGNTTVRPKGVTAGEENVNVPFYTTTMPITSTGLEISEILAGNHTGITDEAGEFEDWIELRNTSDQPISLANLELGQSLLGNERFHFPDTSLAPGAYLVIFCDEHEAAGPWHAPFKISRAGETMLLVRRDAQGGQNLVDRAFANTFTTDISLARLGSQGPYRSSLPTPGGPNVPPQVGMDIFGNQDTGIFLLCRPRAGGGSAYLQTATSLSGPWQDVGAPLITPAGTPGIETYQQWMLSTPRQFFRMRYP